MITALAYIIGLAQAFTLAWLYWERRERLTSATTLVEQAKALGNHKQQLDALDVRASERLRDCDQLFATTHTSRKGKQ